MLVKKYSALLGFVFIVLIPTQIVKSEAISEVEGMYVTTEDIISDIIFPTIDKRVIKEYGGRSTLWLAMEQDCWHYLQ